MTDQRTTTAAAVDGTAEAVAAAICRLGGATAAATPRDIATEAAVAYSTTNKKLRLLRDVGWAESFDSDDRTVWRLTAAGVDGAGDAEQPDPGSPADAAAPPAVGRSLAAGGVEDGTADGADQPAEADGVEDDTAEQDTAATAQDVQPVDPVTEAGPPAQPAGLDEREAPHAGADRPAAADVAEPGRTDDAAKDAALREASPATGDDSDGSPADPGQPAATSPAASPAPAEATAPSKTRRASGTLDGAVMDILEADPDGQYKVGQLCKLIDKANEGTGAAKASPGAVVLACQRLERNGKAVLAVERPATYRLAPPPTT